jgi:hypothetical protein
LGIGHDINTSHLERLHGTLRGQQTRLARRTRNVSRREERLRWALALWRDWYNWMQPHETLGGRTPAMAQGLTDRVWSVRELGEVHRRSHQKQRKLWNPRALCDF